MTDYICHDLDDLQDLIASIPEIIRQIVLTQITTNRLLLLSSSETLRIEKPNMKFQLYTYAESLTDTFKDETKQKKFSLISIDDCVKIRKRVFKINIKNEIFIAVFQIEVSLSNQIEYLIYNKNGELLDMNY